MGVRLPGLEEVTRLVVVRVADREEGRLLRYGLSSAGKGTRPIRGSSASSSGSAPLGSTEYPERDGAPSVVRDPTDGREAGGLRLIARLQGSVFNTSFGTESGGARRNDAPISDTSSPLELHVCMEEEAGRQMETPWSLCVVIMRSEPPELGLGPE